MELKRLHSKEHDLTERKRTKGFITELHFVAGLP